MEDSAEVREDSAAAAAVAAVVGDSICDGDGGAGGAGGESGDRGEKSGEVGMARFDDLKGRKGNRLAATLPLTLALPLAPEAEADRLRKEGIFDLVFDFDFDCDWELGLRFGFDIVVF